MLHWYIYRGEQSGPFSWEEMQAKATNGSLQSQDYVWQEGMPDWVQAGNIEGLFNPRQQQSENITPIVTAGKKYRPVLLGALVVIVVLLAGGLWYLWSDSNVAGYLGWDQVDVGKITIKQPDENKLVMTKEWGEVPVNQLGLIMEYQKSRKDAELVATTVGATIVGEIELIDFYQLELPQATTETDLRKALQLLKSQPGVKIVLVNSGIKDVDIQGTICTPLNDPVYHTGNNLRPFEIIGMKNAWDIIRGSGVPLHKVITGVVDAPLYVNSDEISGKTPISGIDPSDTTSNPEKKNGVIVNDGLNHGTEVSHVIAANPDNGGMTGIAGILGNKLNVKFSSYYGNRQEKGFCFSAMAAITKAVKEGATVINMSIGSNRPGTFGLNANAAQTMAEAAAFRQLFEKMQTKYPNVVFVAAAGNEGADKMPLNGLNYGPGGLPVSNLITVGSVGNNGAKSGFSNFAGPGGEVTLSAPGEAILVGIRKQDGKAINASGTSFSAPMVTATVALLQAINPKLTAEQIKEIVSSTAAKGVSNGGSVTPIAAGMGSGVLRVDDAVLKVINDLRVAKGLKPFDKQTLLDMGRIELKATGGPGEYTIVAALKGLDKNTDIKLETSGSGIVVGNSKQSLSGPGQVSWKITPEGPMFIKAIRLDSNSCAYLNLSNVDIVGSWQGVITINEVPIQQYLVEQSRKIVESIFGSGTGSAVKATDIIGSQTSFSMVVTADPKSNGDYSVTFKMEDKTWDGLNGTRPGSFKNGGFTFDYRHQDYSLIEVMLNLKDTNTLEGTFDVTAWGLFPHAMRGSLQLQRVK